MKKQCANGCGKIAGLDEFCGYVCRQAFYYGVTIPKTVRKRKTVICPDCGEPFEIGIYAKRERCLDCHKDADTFPGFKKDSAERLERRQKYCHQIIDGEFTPCAKYQDTCGECFTGGCYVPKKKVANYHIKAICPY